MSCSAQLDDDKRFANAFVVSRLLSRMRVSEKFVLWRATTGTTTVPRDEIYTHTTRPIPYDTICYTLPYPTMLLCCIGRIVPRDENFRRCAIVRGDIDAGNLVFLTSHLHADRSVYTRYTYTIHYVAILHLYTAYV